jgi:DNA-binding transcriptional LysR family regulator
VRSTRRVELTPAGAALIPEARRTLASARAAADAVAAVEGLTRGTLTLGVMQFGGLFDLAGLLARYRATFPGVRLKLEHASTAELGRFLHDGTVDMTFATDLNGASSDVVSMPLVRSPLVVCTTDAAFGRRRTIALATVADRAQVGFPPGWGVTTLVERVLHSVGIQPHVDLEVNDTNTLLDLVEAGLGVAIIPQAIAQLRPSLHQLAITDGRWHWTIGAQVLAPAPANPAARALWAMLTPAEEPADSVRVRPTGSA